MASRDVNEVVAENLRFHMNRGNYSESSLSRKSGVAQTTIGVYLNPERRVVSASGKLPSGKVSELANLAAALGVHVWELLIDAPPANRAMIRDMIVLMSKPSDAAESPEPTPPAQKASSKKSKAKHADDSRKTANA